MQITNTRIKFDTYLLQKMSKDVKMSNLKKTGLGQVANLEDDTINP